MKRYVIYSMLLYLVLSACQSENNQFEIGEDLVESKTEISMVDSFSIQLSTIRIDSIPTSGQSNALVGYFKNDVTGQIEVQSYFNFELNTALTSISDSAIYDSLTLQLFYSGYLLGDSTLMQNIQVYRLTEPLQKIEDDYSEEYLFNTSQFETEEQPLGTLSFYPQLHKEYEEIRLDDDLGETLLQLGKEEGDEVANDGNFNAFFKGLMLKSDASMSKTIVGFYADSIRLKLYTHIIEQFEPDETVTEFSTSDEDSHFNSIIADRSGTFFDWFVSEREELLSTTTGNKSFIQGGAGILVRLDFPTLNDLYKLEDRILLKAELILRPSLETFSADLPEELNFYETDKVNQMNDLLLDDDDNTLTATLVLDNLYHENTYYIADITTFMSEQLAGNYYNTENGLLVTVPYTDFLSQTDHLILEGEKSDRYQPTLNLYFLTYE